MSVLGMHESPHAFPVVQVLQQVLGVGVGVGVGPVPVYLKAAEMEKTWPPTASLARGAPDVNCTLASTTLKLEPHTGRPWSYTKFQFSSSELKDVPADTTEP